MEARNRDASESSNAVRVSKVAALSVIALAWIAAGVLIILYGCDINPSFAAAWRASTLTVFWTALGGITLCIVIMLVAAAFMPSKPKKTQIPEREQ
jgi:hypothetical protein